MYHGSLAIFFDHCLAINAKHNVKLAATAMNIVSKHYVNGFIHSLGESPIVQIQGLLHLFLHGHL